MNCDLGILETTKMNRHADSNWLAVVLSFETGLLVCEIATITASDVTDSEGNVKSSAALKAHQTEGEKAHTIPQ